MSAEEIIRAWKNKDEDTEKATGQAATNPAGEIELSDAELELAEGGLPRFIASLNESCYEICEKRNDISK